MGVKEGGVLFVQGSFNHLHTFSGTPLDFLSILRNLVGDSGTLLMPVYTKNTTISPPKLFDPLKEPTYCGIVNEIFRRTPGVIRSLHPRHSICGIGVRAEELLVGHDKCAYADGLNSPFDRMRLCKDAQIFTFGVVSGYVSLLHWLEDIEPDKLPYPVHNKKIINAPIIHADGSKGIIKDRHVRSGLKVNFSLHSKKFSSNAMFYTSYKSINFGVYSMHHLADELISLRNKGIIHY
jgi:aminoglycoside 3-N-acetyltransferase